MATDPYEGVIRDKFAESLRLPLIESPYPRWCFITAVVVCEDETLWPGLRPTDDELRVVASFHDEYVEHWYNESYKAKMRQRPFDVDGGAVGRYFIKYGEDDWAYRRSTWEHGPWPWADSRPMGLLPLMDHIHSIGDGKPMARWVQWKTDHPDPFPVVAS